MNQFEVQANQEHRGVAVAVVGVLIISLILGYMLLRRLLPVIFGGTRADYILIAGAGTVLLTVGILWVVDPWVKRLIPSGHFIRYMPDMNRLTYQMPDMNEIFFPLEETVDYTHFYFKMRRFPKSGRERQIPNSWYCCGSRLLMDDKDLTLYTFLPPRKFRSLPHKERFYELEFKDLEEPNNRSRLSRRLPATPTSGPVIPGRLLVGEKGKYWKAEKQRQLSGVELTPADFKTVHDVLKS